MKQNQIYSRHEHREIETRKKKETKSDKEGQDSAILCILQNWVWGSGGGRRCVRRSSTSTEKRRRERESETKRNKSKERNRDTACN